MRLNEAFRKSIRNYLNGKGSKELDEVAEAPFEYTLEAMQELEEELLGKDRETKAKEEKKAKRAKKKKESEEMSEDGDA